MATEIFEDVQAISPVISSVLQSENVPIAVNCWVVPVPIDASAGVTSIDTSSITVTVLSPLIGVLTLLKVAVTVVVPCAIPETEPVPSTVATTESTCLVG